MAIAVKTGTMESLSDMESFLVDAMIAIAAEFLAATWSNYKT